MGLFPLCVGIGLASGVFFIFRRLKGMAISPERENQVMVAVPLTFIIGVVGGYLTDAFLRGGISALRDNPTGWGLTYYGWLLSAIAFLIIYSYYNRISCSFMLNLFLPAFALAQAWGRLGCFLGGCCYGKPAAWGVRYPQGSLPYSCYGSTPLIPVQVFESIYLFCIFFILYKFTRFKKRGALYLLLVPVGRFVLEFFRNDDRGALFGNFLSPSQWISVFLFIIGGSWLFIIMKQTVHTNGIKK